MPQSLTTIVCDSLACDRLPDYEVYAAATWAIQDSIEAVEPAAGRRVNPEEYV